MLNRIVILVLSIFSVVSSETAGNSIDLKSAIKSTKEATVAKDGTGTCIGRKDV
jgi:hypothetical protein